MDRATFSQRSETFGLGSGTSWAEPAFRLLFSMPRSYDPLVRSFDRHHKGTLSALRRLEAGGWVARQAPVVIDTRTGEVAEHSSRKVARYRATAKAVRLLRAVEEDLRVAERAFPRTSAVNLNGVLALLDAFDLDEAHARWGMSTPHAGGIAHLAPRTARWWVHRLVEGGYLRRLDDDVADVRELVPGHWRPTRRLCRQLSLVIDVFDGPVHWKREFRLGRDQFLADIDPVRVGITGATDFDHDVQAQRLLAMVMDSPRCAVDGRLVVEPHWSLPLSKASVPYRFDPQGPHTVGYQPDAEFVERDESGLRRAVLEYERHQTRRDGWNHIERFLGWCHINLLPFEGAVMRFVVDTRGRVRSYVGLIEAFADWCLDHPEAMVANQTTLAVCSRDDLAGATDPLDPRIWHRISLPNGDGGGVPVLHDRRRSPYGEYFTT